MGHHDQHGWDPDIIVEFLQLNPMVATFDWAEILAECDDNPHLPPQPQSLARARLHSHTILHVIAWEWFHANHQLNPEMMNPLGHRFWEFTEWYNTENKVLALFQRWEDLHNI